MTHFSTSFEQALQDNLALYTTQPDVSGKDLFQTHREIAYARYALTQQANTYAKAVEILSTLLETATEGAVHNAKLLTDIMVAINAIEMKSISLISSVRAVTELLGRAVNIDVDKAALSSMVLRLPSLVRETISSASNDPLLADKIAGSLDAKISEMMVAIRFNSVDYAGAALDGPQGISYEQYVSLHDTVPSQPPASTAPGLS